MTTHKTGTREQWLKARLELFKVKKELTRLSWAGGMQKHEKQNSEEGYMCPACIESTALMVAGAASTGGILAVYIGKFRRFVRASRLGRLQKTKEK